VSPFSEFIWADFLRRRMKRQLEAAATPRLPRQAAKWIVAEIGDATRHLVELDPFASIVVGVAPPAIVEEIPERRFREVRQVGSDGNDNLGHAFVEQAPC
jgi:hypothetical protein